MKPSQIIREAVRQQVELGITVTYFCNWLKGRSFEYPYPSIDVPPRQLRMVSDLIQQEIQTQYGNNYITVWANLAARKGWIGANDTLSSWQERRRQWLLEFADKLERQGA